MIQKVKIAVFASGSGSNFSAIEQACQNGELNCEIVLLVTDKPNAFVVERAKEAAIRVAAYSPSTFETKEAYEQALLLELQAVQQNGSSLRGICVSLGQHY